MIDEVAVQQTINRIKEDLADLGRRLQRGNNDELLIWIIPDELACAHRPLRYHPKFGGSGRVLPRQATSEVVRWVERIIECGIRSVICLMHPKEIRHYQGLELGTSDILDFYRKQGLIVHHIPWGDPAHRPPKDLRLFKDERGRIRAEASEAFKQLPKPVLLHCSAGQDRSAPVAAYISHSLRLANGSA